MTTWVSPSATVGCDFRTLISNLRLEIGLGQVGDEGQQLFVGGAVELDQLVELLGALGFLFLVEWPVEKAGEEDARHHDDVVEGLEHLFVVEGVGVGLDGGEEGGVGPGLVVG